MWYAIVRNQQIGPVSTGAIAELIRVGVANAQTYAWAEGMGDWKPLSELPDFAPLLGGSVLDAPGGGRDADEHASTLMMSSDQAQAWAEVLTHLPELANSAVAAHRLDFIRREGSEITFDLNSTDNAVGSLRHARPFL